MTHRSAKERPNPTYRPPKRLWDDRCDRQTPRGVLSRSRRERRYGRRRRSTGDVRVGWELETDTTPDATGDNDFGEAKEPNETDGGYSRYVVSSLLQKAVRRPTREIAAAAWELARPATPGTSGTA